VNNQLFVKDKIYKTPRFVNPRTAGIPIRWPALMEARKVPTLGLLNSAGKGKGIFVPTWGRRIVRGIIRRHNRQAPMITGVPLQFHSVPVLGTVAWTANNIDEITVVSPR
jgi:hypothetical protein